MPWRTKVFVKGCISDAKRLFHGEYSDGHTYVLTAEAFESLAAPVAARAGDGGPLASSAEPSAHSGGGGAVFLDHL